MQTFSYRQGQLYVEDVALPEIYTQYGTPAYIYSRAAIEKQWQQFNNALSDIDHLICYATKANSNIAILNILARLGAGFDIVSIGELERVLAAKGNPDKVVFSGAGKRADELQRALVAGIKCFNIESVSELVRLDRIAADSGIRAPVSIRVNPDVDPNTHPYIATGLKENKFGIAYDQAVDVYQQASGLKNIEIKGIDCHIGSQITEIDPFIDALGKLIRLVHDIESSGIEIKHVDIGGGLGIRYQDETPPTIQQFTEQIRDLFADTNYQVIIEPGRSIIGNAGILLTRVEYIKHTAYKNFAIIDAAMTELLRPALYDAWHEVRTVKEQSDTDANLYDLVGPVCETGDFIAKDRKLALQEGDLLAIYSAGAYGFSMSSTYNSRPRCCELLVDNDRVYEIRRRETIKDLMMGESLIP